MDSKAQYPIPILWKTRGGIGARLLAGNLYSYPFASGFDRNSLKDKGLSFWGRLLPTLDGGKRGSPLYKTVSGGAE